MSSMTPDDLKQKLVVFEQSKREAKRIVDERERAAVKVPKLSGFSLEEILHHEFAKRRTLLARGEHAVLRAGNIAQVYAYRGFGKTWLFETLALVAAYPVEALGLNAPESSTVLYVDGEMASEDVKDRFRLLCDMLKVPRQLGIGAERKLVIVGADWQEEYLPKLDTLEGQTAIEPFVEQADLILLDNRSSLFDPEGEKDPTAWQPAQDWLLSLRRRGKSIVMAHHANRQGGPRGLSKAEDVIDLNIKLSRPEDYKAEEGARFVVEFDKARGIHGPAAAPFTATLGPKGWVVESARGEGENAERKVREYLLLAERAGESPRSGNDIVAKVKVGRSACFELIASWRERGWLIKEDGGLLYRGPGWPGRLGEEAEGESEL